MPVIDMAATGRKIHDLRVAAGMTIRDIRPVVPGQSVYYGGGSQAPEQRTEAAAPPSQLRL